MATVNVSQTQFEEQLEDKWNQLRGRVKERWGKLTDEDLDVIAGKQEQLVGKLQESYDIARDEAEAQVKNFVADLDLDQFKVEHDFTRANIEEGRFNWRTIGAGILALLVLAMFLKYWFGNSR